MEGTVFQSISDFIATYLPTVLIVIGAAASIATLTPNKTDDKILQLILDLVNFVGANFGKAKNNDS